MKKFSITALFTLLAIAAIVSAAFAEGAALPGSGWYSGEQIQNVGSAQASIDVTAYDSASSAQYSFSSTINPGAANTYLPNNFPGMPDGFQGSAIVSSSQDIRAVVNVTNRYIASLSLGDSAATHPAAGLYQGMNVPSTTLNFPLVKNDYFAKTTSFFIQNAGSAAATATATFVVNGVTYNHTTSSIGPGQMVMIVPGDAGVPTGNSALGSLTVTSAQPLAGSVLEHRTSEAHASLLQATRAFTSSDYDTTIFVPSNKNNYFGRFSGLQVQNVSNGAVDMTVVYKGCTGGDITVNANGVAAGASHNFESTDLPDGCFASAQVTSTGNVVATVNESYTSAYLAATGRTQESITYSAIPASAATMVISLPLYKEDAFSKATGVSIQNVSASVAHVVLTFKSTAGTFVSNSISIDPGTSFVVIDVRNKPASFWNGTAMTPSVLGCVSGVNACGQNGTFGLIVTSDQNVVAIANESTYPIQNPRIQQDKSTYEGFNLTAAP